MALWGTGYDEGRAFIEIEHRHKMVKRYWTKPGQTQQQIKRAVTEAMRGGFTLHVTQVRENRAYLESRHVDVPWSNKDLELKWEHFTSKLEPGQKETWTAVIDQTGTELPKASGGRDGGDALRRVARSISAASLAASASAVFRYDHAQRSQISRTSAKSFQHLHGSWATNYVGVDLRTASSRATWWRISGATSLRAWRAERMAQGGVAAEWR